MILLAESGSTKTDWRLLGENILSFETSGLNPYFISSETVEQALTPFLNDETKFRVKEVHFYGTGITDPSKGKVIETGIRKSLSDFVQIHTYSDVIAAARALFGDQNGIACILGTGSNSCFWNGTSIEYQIPPLGFWLGDEGSGGYLGKTLIQSYLHKEMPDDIRTKFETVYGQKDRLEILNHAYQQEKPNRYFAQYCPFLLDNATHTFCTELLENAFRLFIEKYLLKYPQLSDSQIGAVGSVAWHLRSILNDVAKRYGLHFSKIIQRPIDDLIRYHQSQKR